MAAVSTITALALAAAAAGTQYYNTQQTAKKQDSALATQLRNQGTKQREADAKVGDEVAKLQASTADGARREKLDGFLTALRDNRGKTNAGLTPNIGSDAFRADAAQTAAGIDQYGADSAGMLSRIDAAGAQRQQEGVGYGHLSTDLGLIGREAQGQNFLDELRLRAVRRNAGLDAAASLMSGASSGMATGGGGSDQAAAAAMAKGLRGIY